MAYINIAEWTPDQVTDWIKGLDESMKSYWYEFSKHEIGGRSLLNIRPYELENLGMKAIGHQEIVLEAVENLRDFHYHLKNDNLQFMALHVGTAARNLHRELAKNHADSNKIDTRVLHDITRTIATLKPLIGSLERSPFRKQDMYREYCSNVLRCGLELAMVALRDRFAVRPVAQIKAIAERLERLANFIIQDISDPMVLQPASLNLVTLKKRESDLGFNIESRYNGIHRVTDIKYNSPAHNSGKIEDGDEIVQINYQTVVGWQHKTVLEHLREALPDVVLTVKKRPKHTKMFGQIYMQPYRLPSKKRNMASRWAENSPSPRAAFLTLDTATETTKALSGEKQPMAKVETTTALSDSDSSDSCDIPTPTDTKCTTREIRLYYPKPRALLQRRNTICGDEFLSLKHSDLVIPSWHERKPGQGGTGASCEPDSPSIRDKSVSFGYGLELTPRPTTCIGFSGCDSAYDARRLFNESRKLKQLTEASLESEEQMNRYKPGVSKVVRFDAHMRVEDYVVKNEKFTCNVENTILETFEPIPFADEGDEDALETLRNCQTQSTSELLQAIEMATKGNDSPLIEAINMPLLQQNKRGRLDKSHSTPAYDNSGEESDTPPAIEPRKEFLLVTPPAPPPRPRKQRELTPPALPPPPPKPASLQVPPLPPVSVSVPIPVPMQAQSCGELSELHTPSKTRTLTLKKKHSLMAKRRNTNLKLLGTGDIQGHLYRRKKNQRGVTYWARIYFVMLDTILYGFRNKQSTTASLVIFLPGFTVSLAKEVHSKPYAFKVYHTAKTFYFAAESQDALNQWVEFLKQASLKMQDVASQQLPSKELYSENDSSGEECDALVSKNLCTPSPQGAKDVATSFSGGSPITPPTTLKPDRSYLDSLRKFTNTFKSSSTKASSDIPVPTEQYRSYRKVPGGSFGIQIGANTPGYHDPAMPPTALPSCATLPRKLSRSSSRSSLLSNSESTASLGLGPPTSPAPTVSSLQHQSSEESASSSKSSLKKVPFPYNFLHASNPNLVEFDFHTSKTLLPKMSAGTTLDHHHNIQGFVTLKDLMLRKQEEEAQEMYNNRVHLGVEKQQHMRHESIASQQSVKLMPPPPPPPAKPVLNAEKLPKIQSCSLPKTPDYEISFKPDDESIKRTRTKEGLKLRDFGYELIYGDEPATSSSNSSNHTNTSNTTITDTHETHSSHAHLATAAATTSSPFSVTRNFLRYCTGSGSSASDLNSADKILGGTKKKQKSSSDRRFPFGKHSTGAPPTVNPMTMTLPLNKKSKSNHALDGMSCLGGASSGSNSIKKSQTYNQDLREKLTAGKYDAQRKNSAPMHLFSKLSMPSSSPSSSSSSFASKEKRILGSPLLHRTLFGHHQQQQEQVPSVTPSVSIDSDYDQEIFTQVILPPRYATNLCASESLQPPLPPAPPPPTVNTTSITTTTNISSSSSSSITTNNTTTGTVTATDHGGGGGGHEVVSAKVSSASSLDSKAATPDYPNMECPPVFEAEIYSLSEPNNSLSRLMLRNNSGSNSASSNNTNNTNNNNNNTNCPPNASGGGGEHQS